MQLSKSQLETYERDGFLVMPELFSPREVGAMKAELSRIQDIDTDHLVRERTGGIAKTIYRVHASNGPTASPVFHAAARSPRLLQPAQELLSDDALYVYHTKCNLKTAIDGSVWQWHQDYGTWKKDGVPDSTLTTALIMLDEPTEFNGCLYFIPGSHKEGNLEPRFDDSTAYKFWIVPKDQLLSIMQRSPDPVPITGKPGSVVFFHPNILHASGHNLSRHDRWAIYVVYNPVVNQPTAVPNPRPDYVRSTNFAPLAVGTDDILAANAANAPAAEVTT
jgi:ectoine hydroxylase